MPDSLCRLTIQHDGADGHQVVDLALPSTTSVSELMPSICDIVVGDAATPTTGCGWHLSRVGGRPLHEFLTLEDNKVRDGELLLLTSTETPAPEWVDADPSHMVARIDNAGSERLTHMLPSVCCVFVGGIVAAALIWTGADTPSTGNLMTAACVAAAAAAGAIVSWRTRGDPLTCVPLSFVAVVSAATVGFLAVPAGPLSAHVLLGSAAAFSAAVLNLSLMRCGMVSLTAIATAAALTTAVSAAVVTWELSAHAAGASLATLALATLGIAPRLAIAVTGIRPPTPNLDDEGEPAVITRARATVAHQLLTGLVAGSSIAAALGAATVVVGFIRDGGSALIAGSFTMVIGLVLILRARLHADATRRALLVVGGMASATACFVLAVVSAPGHAHWFSALAAAAGAAALSRHVGITVGPLGRRTVEVIDYLAVATVVPLACWVGGLYGVVRGMGLL